MRAFFGTSKKPPYHADFGLFGFFMLRVLFAERTIFIHNESVRIVLFVLNTVVISVLAFGAFKRNFGSCRFGCHNQNSIQKITPLDRRVELVYHTFKRLSIFFAPFSNFFYIFTKGFFRGISPRKNCPIIFYIIYTQTRKARTRVHAGVAHERIMRRHRRAHIRTRATSNQPVFFCKRLKQGQRPFNLLRLHAVGDTHPAFTPEILTIDQQ